VYRFTDASTQVHPLYGLTDATSSRQTATARRSGSVKGVAAILKAETYDGWLGLEPDPYDLLITYPSEPMTMWPISTRVNKPENHDPSILDRAAEPVDWQAPIPDDARENEHRSCAWVGQRPK
jgi:hypothetical protein